METEKYTNTIHLGRKIERVRRLRGMTQAELGDLLGITKQAVSREENKIYINSSFSPTNNQTSFLSNSLRKGSSLNSEEPRLIPKKRKTKKRKL